MKYDESEVLNLLREAHAEPIDAAHYTAVRSRVLAEIERTRSPWRRLAWVSGVGTLAAAIVLAVVLRPLLGPDAATPPRIAATIPQAPAVLAAAATPQPRSHHRDAPRLVARSTPPVHEPFTVKIQTEDPNIVIYWIAN